MGLFTSARLFNAWRNSRQTHSQFLVYRKKSLTFLIFDVGQLIFRDSKAGMVPSTLGMCRYISDSEIVCRGPKTFENPCPRVYFKLRLRTHKDFWQLKAAALSRRHASASMEVIITERVVQDSLLADHLK